MTNQSVFVVILILNILISTLNSSPLNINSIKIEKFENLANCGVSNQNNVAQYIVGGSEATHGQFPWQVSVQKSAGGLWFHVCGGVILNTNWILTAAHCINGLEESAVRAVVGAHLLNETIGGQTNHEISRIIKHESYDSKTLLNDLALIGVRSPLNLDNSEGYVNSVCLPIEGQKFTQYVTLSGWGTTVSGGQTPSNKLMFVNDVPIVSLPKCRSIYGFNAIREGMLCAGAQLESGRGLCQGDSGGPLIQKDPNGKAVLVGLSSFNRQCASSDGIPDVFVEISFFRDWIDGNAI